ncbi:MULTISPECIES: ATP-binding protein [unclassified Leptolyngbya]|uniref:ATP-binding protein n=1 Tax=unclassified Leptolyngbya TaxID=2650499 RepID=UPI001688DDB1|nr:MULTISPECIES: ATP-binding protein [unclassified Leptolyngbya]MBD1913964.1 response regulator [Leptolyngbya sp. FACHB-8]MBD2155931.1 response regulator [Leptolyngbya sp. FACHB-16]
MISTRQNNVSYAVAIALGAIAFLLTFTGGWKSLLSVSGFIPHGHCYLWRPGLVWMHVISDSLIAIAYVAISATLAYLVYKTRREIPFHWMFLAFGSFIVACASTHFMDVWTLWHPTYWLSGALKVVTAIASVTTAVILPMLVPQALALVEAAKLSEERRSHLETANLKLEAFNERLKELDVLKTQFFTNVSHELRTPLALILGPLETLLSRSDLPSEQRQSLDIVERNARLLLKQVNDLLDVSKLEANKMAVTYVPVDLAHLVRLTAANFDGIAQEKQITFIVDVPESLPLQLDAAKTQRICLNLLSNAFKFTPQGGTIRCRLRVQSVEADNSEPLPRAVLSVQDSGCGVPVELRETIFERFSQGEGGTTRRFGGTGLGLAITREFVTLQGGTITVGDAPDGGAQFTVELPIHALSGEETTSPYVVSSSDDIANLIVEELRTINPAGQSGPVQPEGKPLVLVVEDNPEMNQFITSTLASDYRTATASNGKDGLEQAIALQPDLILSDVMMPYLSGDQFIHQLRTYPELDTIPVVMLTAKSDVDLRIELLRWGAQDYLMKPFSVEELRVRIGNLIAINRVRDRLQRELASQSHDLEALVEEVSQRRQELQIAVNTLQVQTQKLEQANRLKEEFLGLVSHELRTPLNSILGWSQALRSRKFDATVTERALETIERNARLQTQLIDNLLDISRLLRGEIALNCSPVSLPVVLTQVLETIQPVAASKSIHLESQIPDAIAPIPGDPDRLREVFEHLLANAVKFTPQDGSVKVALKQNSSNICLQISDTGLGIRPEALPYIFECFRQADASNTRSHGGLGLGLAIARQLVELHGGSIQAESPGEGKGAIFTVTLPTHS